MTTAATPVLNSEEDFTLLRQLVAWVDRRHEYRTGGCHPVPPEDCEVWCEACSLLRQVRDDLLIDARAINRQMGYER